MKCFDGGAETPLFLEMPGDGDGQPMSVAAASPHFPVAVVTIPAGYSILIFDGSVKMRSALAKLGNSGTIWARNYMSCNGIATSPIIRCRCGDQRHHECNWEKHTDHFGCG